MDLKRITLILSIIVLFSSIIAVSADDTQYDIYDIQQILKDYDAEDMTGCCSVVLQEEGNNSIISFRRDAGNAADIYIEKVNWHGKEALKQYKTSAGYFCQVIVTNDGWIIGYGGIDDGPDNEKIEEITGNMLNNTTKISESTLQQIQSIKASYGLGHFVIKAPNGDYGIATATTYSTGKLKPGEYLSLPNRINFMRTGTLDLNTSDKISAMVNLAISDGFGLTRRDVTTFDFQVVNETTNVTYAYVSNDDGSMFGMSTAGLCDNVNFTGKIIKAEDIPIAPKYKAMGNVTFEKNETSTQGGLMDTIYYMVIYSIILIVIAVIAFFAYHTIVVLRYRRRMRDRYRRR